MPPAADPVRLPFTEQIAFFRKKLNLPTERWTDIKRAAHDRAFVVAGAMQADLLDDLRQAVDGGIAGGDTIVEFRKNFLEIIERRGWVGFTGDDRASQGPKGGRALAWRTRTIYNTNLVSSRAAGRWQQLNDPDLLRERPFWQYVHSDFVANPRPQHKAWGNARLTLPHDHPFWATHFPPNGWGCRCTVKAVRAPKAADATEPPDGWDARDHKGRLPGVDPGWDYAPGANAATPLAELVARKLVNLDAGIGAAMMQELRPALLAEQTAAFAEFVDTTLATPKPTGRAVVVGALLPAWVKAAQRVGLTPATSEIAVRDRDIWHTFRSGKTRKLDLAWYKALPRHLAEPEAVLLDTTKPLAPAFLLIYAQEGSAAKLVVAINYHVKKQGVMNLVETGKALDAESLATIRREIGRTYVLVEGSL